MKNGTFSYVLKLGITLFLITAIVAGLLGLVNFITKGKIAAANQEKSDAAKAAVLAAENYTQLDELPDGTDYVKNVWEADDKGYVVECVIGGSQGDIDLMIGVGMDGNCKGISVISSSETAGLGAVAAEDSEKGEAFRAQYEGRAGGMIDAISGATITSTAITDAVNDAVKCVQIILIGKEAAQ